MSKDELIHTIVEEKTYREKRRGKKKKNLATVKEATEWLNVIIDVIEDALLSGEKVKLPTFGSLEVRTRSAYDGIHPRTGEPMRMPEVKLVRFNTSDAFRKKLEGKEGEFWDEEEDF